MLLIGDPQLIRARQAIHPLAIGLPQGVPKRLLASSIAVSKTSYCSISVSMLAGV